MDVREKLKKVPKDKKFQYLRSYNEIINIRKNLKNFSPQTMEQQQWLVDVLKQYEYHFRVLENIEKEIS